MTAYEIISKKRDGKKLSEEEIRFFIDGYTRGEIPDYQMSALLMAVFLNDMDDEETKALTKVMLYSGEVVDLSDIPGIKVDKHSTGGVGDKLSLIIAPVVAAAGVPVPMISGRGLGHSGGTLDKLESIPGFNVNYSVEEYRKIISEINVCLIGQTGEIAPADKKIYALRDVTATVQSIPLITASIMSKKLAEGIDALVLDVKSGRGAFMENEERAIKLAQSLVGVGELFGKSTIGLMTDMDMPLGYAVGNWLEVKESVEALRGNGPADVMEISLALSGVMIHLGGKAPDIESGIQIAEETLNSGKALDKFIEIVKRQEGDASVIENPEKYPVAGRILNVTAPADGYIGNIDALEIGLCSVETGAGRLKAEDPVDAQAGILLFKHYGDKVKAGEKLAEIHTNLERDMSDVSQRVQTAFHLTEEVPQPRKLIRKKISMNGVEEWM